MQSAAPGQPSRETGLPPGVEVAPLGARFLAYLIDISVPAVVNGVVGAWLPNATGTLRLVLLAVAGVVTVAWTLLLWFRLAGKAATPGLQAMKLQLVGFYDGRSIGVGRVFVRGLILWVLSATGIGLVIMLILMVLHPRRQGWHDQAVKAVMIKQRTAASPPAQSAAAPAVEAPGQPGPGAQPQYGRQAGYSGRPQPGQPQPGQPQPGQPQFGQSQPGYPQGGYPQSGYQQGQYPPPGYPSGPPSGVPPFPPTPASAPSASPQPPPASPQQPPPARPPSAQPLTPPSGPGYPPQPGGYSPIPGGGYQPPQPSSAPSAPEAEYATSATRPMTSVPPASCPEWVAVLDDGREITVDGLVLLGRNPQPQPGEEDAQLIKIADETRTVSKSHLAIGLDASGIFVVDRGSTNGSTVTTPEGVSTRCRTGEVIYVQGGSIVSIGDHWLEIRRS